MKQTTKIDSKGVKMISLLISPFTKKPAASIEEGDKERTLKILDETLRKDLEVNGITLSKKADGSWRVFPDGDPRVFLEAFENDLYKHGLMQQGYYWISEEDYADEGKWIKKVIDSAFHEK